MLYAGRHQILRNGGLTDSRRMDHDHTVSVNAQTSGTRLGVTQVGDGNSRGSLAEGGTEH